MIPKPPFLEGPHPRAGDRRVRAAEAAPRRGLGRAHHARGGAAHVGRGALAHPRPERAAEDRGGELLRGAAALPPHPPAQPAGADGVRHLAARPPDHPRVLPAVPRRHPGQPRALAPHAALRRRRLAALAHREDPGAAAAHRADPRRDHGPVEGLPDRLQLDAPRAEARRAPRGAAQRLRPAASPTSARSRGAGRSSARPGWTCPVGFEDLHTPHDVEEALDELRGRRPGIRRAVVKLDESFSGEGNALFRYPESDAPAGAARGAAAGGVLGGLGDARRPTSTSSRRWAGSSRSSSRPRRSSRRAPSCGSARAGDVLADLHPRPDPRS